MLDGAAILSDTAVATPAAPPVYLPLVTISALDADTVRLSWPHPAGYLHYRVWRGAAPYFRLSGPDAGAVFAAPWQFDDDALGDPAVNRYYRVVGLKQDGGASISARAGEFDFTLTPGN